MDPLQDSWYRCTPMSCHLTLLQGLQGHRYLPFSLGNLLAARINSLTPVLYCNVTRLFSVIQSLLGLDISLNESEKWKFGRVIDKGRRRTQWKRDYEFYVNYFELGLNKLGVFKLIHSKLYRNFGRVSPIILTNQKPAKLFKNVHKPSRTIL